MFPILDTNAVACPGSIGLYHKAAQHYREEKKDGFKHSCAFPVKIRVANVISNRQSADFDGYYYCSPEPAHANLSQRNFFLPKYIKDEVAFVLREATISTTEVVFPTRAFHINE